MSLGDKISRTIMFQRVIKATGRGMAVGVWGLQEKDREERKMGLWQKSEM